MADSTSIIDFTHEEFIRGIKRIAAYVKASDFEPDYIVGIVRGGAVPAGLS